MTIAPILIMTIALSLLSFLLDRKVKKKAIFSYLCFVLIFMVSAYIGSPNVQLKLSSILVHENLYIIFCFVRHLHKRKKCF